MAAKDGRRLEERRDLGSALTEAWEGRETVSPDPRSLIWNPSDFKRRRTSKTADNDTAGDTPFTVRPLTPTIRRGGIPRANYGAVEGRNPAGPDGVWSIKGARGERSTVLRLTGANGRKHRFRTMLWDKTGRGFGRGLGAEGKL